MNDLSRTHVRVVVVAVVALCALVLVHGWATGLTSGSAAGVPPADSADDVTVVTESAKYGTLVAYAPDGSVLYHNDTHDKYFDVDPVEGTAATVEYTAVDTIEREGPTCQSPPCTRNLVERTNLTTGEVTRVYVRYDYRSTAGEWHDADRIDEETLVVADIVDDQVFVVDTTTGLVEWRWDAQGDFPVAGGGPYPGDWAHINDVEVLPDGRIMVSLRNQDQVVFLDRETGLVEDWTLGADDDHDVLYEQHNPDYIPAERGGPAVVLADSENGRIVEYQRVDGDWERTWTWADDRLQWPRDADRLPDGNTLVVDTHGRRVIEVDPSGAIVWQADLPHPYDAERLGTGDESAGGHSARELGLESRDGDGSGFSRGDDELLDPVLDPLAGAVKAVVPPRVVNGVIFVVPTWVGRSEFFAASVAAVALLGWAGLEARWRFPRVRFRSPVTVEREE